MTTLVLGIGNPTRCDDAAGVVIAERIAARTLPGVTVRTMQQLTPELVEVFAAYDRIVVVDAAVEGEAVGWRRVGSEGTGARPAASHHLRPETLAELARRLYGRGPEVFLCTVRGEHFGFGTGLSGALGPRIEAAVTRIAAFLGPAFP
jgi:hydrogenase maturation protease